MKRIIKISLFLVFFLMYFFMLTNCNEKKSPKLKFILPLLASTNQSASSLTNLVPSTGNLGGVSGADNSCNSDANKPNDGSTYKAILVDATNRIACSSANCTLATENVNWVLRANLNYIRASDAASLFTSNSAGIFAFGNLTNSFDTSANKYWTGLNANWTANGSHCTQWGNTGSSGVVGNGNQTNNNAINLNSPSCSGVQNLLCAEQ